MVNEALRRLVSDLEAHRIEYSVIGAVALNQHGYQRFTTDIDLLMSPEGLERFRNELVGRGYRPAFNGATKKFREPYRTFLSKSSRAGSIRGMAGQNPSGFTIPAYDSS